MPLETRFRGSSSRLAIFSGQHPQRDATIKAIGGRHVDLVYSDKTKLQYIGLTFKKSEWWRSPNGDGETVEAFPEVFDKDEEKVAATYVYKGYIISPKNGWQQH